MSAKQNYIMIETARDLYIPVKVIKRLCRCSHYAVEHRDLCSRVSSENHSSPES